MAASTTELSVQLSGSSGEQVKDTEQETLACGAENSKRKSRSGYKRISALWMAMLLKDASEEKTDSHSVMTDTSVSRTLPSAIYDQGCHEVEVEAEGYEASARWTLCQKNVGHTDFIKPNEFTMAQLPQAHHDKDIFSYIKLWSQLVVKVIVRNISLERPEGYAFYNYRGKRLPITGTGKVAEIITVTDNPCPCPECLKSGCPRREWKAVWVMTAMHVVFDDSEVTNTDIELFYDHSDNKDGVRKLRGIRVVDCNIKGDWCKFECATHDLDLGQHLEKIDAEVLTLGKIIKEKHHAHNFPPLAVIASHPHGCSKFITVGEWKDRKLVKNKEENYEWTEYLYTTSTCTGCSGAPVWIIGPERLHYSYNYYSHVHSEGLKCGLNKSGAGDVEKRWDEY